jgi:hypothetical protein
MKQLLLPILSLAFLLTACERTDIPPIEQEQPFDLTLYNSIGLQQAQYAAYLTDEDGKVLLFKWIKANDSTHLTLLRPDQERYQCNVMKMTILQTVNGPDTTIEMTSYPDVSSNQGIYLRNLAFQQVTDLQVQFINITSLDSIIVPDGLTFIRPQPGNNYFGQYRVRHAGAIWLRVRVNGDPHWRYMTFDNIGGASVSVTIDPNLLPVMDGPARSVEFPFLAPWRYNVYGVLDLTQRKLVPIGDLNRAPGGAVPVLGELSVFQPLNQTYAAYRLTASGHNEGAEGYAYYSDNIWNSSLPERLPTADFDITPTIVSDNRIVAFSTYGEVDVVRVIRQSISRPNIIWTAWVAPDNGFNVVHRLPNIPAELARVLPALARYDFGNLVRVRAERYDRLEGIEAVLRQEFAADDPLWVPKAGLLSKEKTF